MRSSPSAFNRHAHQPRDVAEHPSLWANAARLEPLAFHARTLDSHSERVARLFATPQGYAIAADESRRGRLDGYGDRLPE